MIVQLQKVIDQPSIQERSGRTSVPRWGAGVQVHMMVHTMAGWEHHFDIDKRDTRLLTDCLRLLRRTCARHYVEMEYYRDGAISRHRDRYVIGYNLNSTSLGIAADDFLTEMRAISVLQQHPRQTRLPLRLARDVAYSAVWTLEHQIEAGEIADLSPSIQELLEDLQTSYWIWRVGITPDHEFLEALHTFVIHLALEIAVRARSADSYSVLVQKLVPDRGTLQTDLLDLGMRRNRVKHRGTRAEAGAHARMGIQAVWQLTHALTGFYSDPISPNIRKVVSDPNAVFNTPPMFTRSGDPRVVRR